MWDLVVSVPDHCLSFYFSGCLFLRLSKHSELPRPILKIRPWMYEKRTIMYEIAKFCSPEEHA